MKKILALLALAALLAPAQVTVNETTETVTETVGVDLQGVDNGLTVTVSLHRDALSAVSYQIRNAAGEIIGSGTYDLVKLALVSQDISSALGAVVFSAGIEPEGGVSWSMTAGGETVSGVLTTGETTTGGGSEPPPPPPPTEPPPVSDPEVGFYVAPNGSPSGDGSIENPWDLKTALAGPAELAPGDTVWIREGSYGAENEPLPVLTVGTETAPIIFRRYPGERARVLGWLHYPPTTGGSYTYLWGLEVYSENTNRTEGSTTVQDGVDLYSGRGNKLLNCVIHNRRNGVGDWSGAKGTEVYGCLIYYNGARGSTRGHYHGIYAQNDGEVSNSRKVYRHNIFHNSYGYGMQLYGGASPTVYADAFTVEENAFFQAGAMYAPFRKHDNLLLGGAQGNPKTGTVIRGNLTYHALGEPATGIFEDDGYSRIGLNWDEGGAPDPAHPNSDVEVLDNFFIGGENAAELWFWDFARFRGNTIFSNGKVQVNLRTTPEQASGNVPGYDWDGNAYFGNDFWTYNASSKTFETWKSSTGLDATSTFTPGRPSGVWSFVFPNEYEPKRANVVAYNWDRAASIAVDLSTVLAVGDAFEVRSATDFFGPPVASGVYDGAPVSIPMTGLAMEKPVGLSAPPSVAPDFSAFVVVPAGY